MARIIIRIMVPLNLKYIHIIAVLKALNLSYKTDRMLTDIRKAFRRGKKW